MKQSALTMIVFLFFTIGLHAQNQLSLKIDTLKTGLLGFNKQNRWPLNLKNSPKSEFSPLIFQEQHAEKSHHGITSEWNMQVHEPESHHDMPVQVPDSTINYSIKIVRPENN